MEKVLRASGIGHPCDRNLWYGCNGYRGMYDTKALRIFAVGHALEPLAVQWLQDEGWHLEHNAGSQEAEQEVRIPVGDVGWISGHHDIVMTADHMRISRP